MFRPTLFWKIFPAFLGIVLASLLALTWFTANELRDFFMDTMRQTLENRAELASYDIRELYPEADRDQIDSLCKRIGRITDSRVTVIAPNGEVLGDSHQPASQISEMDNHADRPEVRMALLGKTGYTDPYRYSATLGQNMIYVAVPLLMDGEVLAIVRTSWPLQSFEEALSAAYFKIGMSGLAVALAAIFLSFAASRTLTRPLAEIRRGVEKFANGKLETRLPAFDTEEYQLLAQTMNQMAAHLDDRIRAVIQQRNEVEAILSSMAEGVLAVDTNQNVIKLNRKAAEMLEIDIKGTEGRSVQAVIRNAGLQKALTQTLTGETAHVSEKITFYNGGERCFQVNGTLVKDAGGRRIGAVLVLNDITQMRKLENIRKDFVANVSHELRTPITSIQGFVETLQDGALENKEDTRRFLNIIRKQTNRLNAIIEDLLLLSRVEREGGEPSFKFEHYRLKDVLLTAIQMCEHKAKDKSITLDFECPSDIQADLNPLLMEQAVVNMIDNAINYSQPETHVEIRGERQAEEFVISVTDHGCGIPDEHLPRIFERFYRVDRARSRQLGGTGLGLAILKHVAQAHDGRVSVESTVGRGSTFRIHLPV